MRLVKIPGSQTAVNPEYVTSVRPAGVAAKALGGDALVSEVEFEGNAGYRTRSVYSTATVDQLLALFEGSKARK